MQIQSERPSLTQLAFDERQPRQADVAEVLKGSLDPFQLPELLILQKRIASCADQALSQRLGKRIHKLSNECDSEERFMKNLTEEYLNQQSPLSRIRKYLKENPNEHYLHAVIKKVLDRMQPEFFPDIFIREVLQTVREQDTQEIASEPFLRECEKNGVDAKKILSFIRKGAQRPAPANFFTHILSYSYSGDPHICHPVLRAAIELNLILLKKFFQDPAQFNKKTPLGGSVYDILKAKGFERIDPLQKVPSTGWTPAEYEEIMGKKYLPRTIFENVLLFKLFETKFENPELFASKWRESFIAAKKAQTPPPVQLFKFESGPLEGQYALKASRALEAGDFIIEYTGRAVLIPNRNWTRSMVIHGYEPMSIDAEHEGSLAEFINHGPPNCRSMTIYFEGIPREAIFALRKILQGEILYLHYGPTFFTSLVEFQELAPELVDNYIQETKGLTLLKPIDSTISGKVYFVEVIGQQTEIKELPGVSVETAVLQIQFHCFMLDYIFNYPERLYENIRCGKVNKTALKALLALFHETGYLNSSLRVGEDGYQELLRKIAQI